MCLFNTSVSQSIDTPVLCVVYGQSPTCIVVYTRAPVCVVLLIVTHRYGGSQCKASIKMLCTPLGKEVLG